MDKDGIVSFTGYTKSSDFPVTSDAPQKSHAADAGEYDALVARISAGATKLLFGTFLGGTAPSYAIYSVPSVIRRNEFRAPSLFFFPMKSEP